MKIFVGGSKRIAVLPNAAFRQLDAYREQGCAFLVGDCHGVDAGVQKYLADCGERRVTVYCSGRAPRHNVGAWPVVALCDTTHTGYAFYRQKDIRMAEDADGGYMVWDGVSKGTKQNAEDLRARSKPVRIETISAR